MNSDTLTEFFMKQITVLSRSTVTDELSLEKSMVADIHIEFPFTLPLDLHTNIHDVHRSLGLAVSKKLIEHAKESS